MEEAYADLEQEIYVLPLMTKYATICNISEQEFQQMLQEVAVTADFSLEDPIREEESETRLILTS